MPRDSIIARTTLAQTMVELADSLVDDFDVIDVLDLLVARSVDLLDVGAAGVMLRSPDGDLRVVATSSEALRVLELFELQSQEGPGIDCLASATPVVEGDLSTADGRWPDFAAKTLAAGFRSVHVVPMRLRGTVIGAVSLFRGQPGTMAPADVDAAQALADVATIALLQHRAAKDAQLLAEQLDHALSSRVVIEQAKGVIAERDGLDMDEAFSVLRSYARSNNLRLADVAAQVVRRPRKTL